MEQRRFRHSLPSRRIGKWRPEDIASTATRIRTEPNHPVNHRPAAARPLFRFSSHFPDAVKHFKRRLELELALKNQHR
jgi:hypothetical protein